MPQSNSEQRKALGYYEMSKLASKLLWYENDLVLGEYCYNLHLDSVG